MDRRFHQPSPVRGAAQGDRVAQPRVDGVHLARSAQALRALEGVERQEGDQVGLLEMAAIRAHRGLGDLKARIRSALERLVVAMKANYEPTWLLWKPRKVSRWPHFTCLHSGGVVIKAPSWPRQTVWRDQVSFEAGIPGGPTSTV